MGYSLVGLGNDDFTILGYTSKALESEGLGHLSKEMLKRATSADGHRTMIKICNEYLTIANESAMQKMYPLMMA